ncbi:MAG: alpha/beta fold hydrolase [Defluviicoccus sp.]|nr:alpha/beta fold hydrolase [Defluviicoccus sp.]MDE0386062.1 alpha/beta fold hydrolase [Defluviicoccus sp.]
MIQVYFATNREISLNGGSPEFGNAFNLNSPHNLRFGWAKVREKSEDDYVVTSIHVTEDPTTPEFDSRKLSKGTVVGSKGTFETIRKEMEDGKCDVLCFIHGYASDFKTTLARTAEISANYSTAEKRVIGFVFSWPSNGRMLPMIDYYLDRDDAKASGFAIARVYQLLVDFLRNLPTEDYCQQAIHLLAHSMGNWALGNALDDIVEIYNGAPPRLFDQVFLMAADADNNAMEKGMRLERLPDICKGINIYFSQDDRALMISDVTKFNRDRLGATGPRYRDNLDRKVTLVDCQYVDTPDRSSEEPGKRWDLSVHQYYRLRHEVIEDVQQVLSGIAPGGVQGRRYLQEDRSFQVVPFNLRPQGTG